MNLFNVSSILITICAFGSFINYKSIKLPSSIALLLLSMSLGLLGIFLKKMGFIDNTYAETFLSSIDFKETVFHGMLSFLLFSGALQIGIEDLKKVRLLIIVTSIVSTFISTLIIGSAFYFLAHKLGFTNVTFLYAMLFGSILSPTDPITVFSIIQKMRASKKIETAIMGESLFNDGVALVFFFGILELIKTGKETSSLDIASFFFQEVAGGILFGAAIGWIAYQMLKRVNAYHIELFITLAVATGGYILAEKLNFAAPLSMVIAGIIIGNHGRSHSAPAQIRKFIYSFWEAINEILVTVLFFLIGLEMMVIKSTFALSLLGLGCIFIALMARFISIAAPLALLHPFHPYKRETVVILTWGGLRGALSIAMALSLQLQSMKEIFLPCIYFVVIFSITVQGLTLSQVIKMNKIELVEDLKK